MNTLSIFRAALRLGLPITLVLATCLGQAQTRRSVAPAAQPAGPSMAARTTAPAPTTNLPAAVGNPAGLTSQFPAGLPSPVVNPAGLSAGTAPASDTVVVPAPTVMGAAGPGVSVPRQSAGTGAGPYTPLQVAQSFFGADTNHDGELTRAEASRLTIAAYGFEEMDSNHDGIVSRSEYEDSLR